MQRPMDQIQLMLKFADPYWDQQRGEYMWRDNKYALINPVQFKDRPKEPKVTIRPISRVYPISAEELVEKGYDLTDLPTKIEDEIYEYAGERYRFHGWTPEHLTNQWVPILELLPKQTTGNAFEGTPGLLISEVFPHPMWAQMPLSNSAIKLVVATEESGYFFDGCHLRERMETGKDRKLTNFTVMVTGKTEIMYPRSKKSDYAYDGYILLANGKKIHCVFTLDQKGKLVEVAKRVTKGLTYLEPTVGENYVNRVLEKMVTETINKEELPTFLQIKEAGWCEIRGRMYYVSDDKSYGNKLQAVTGVRFVKEQCYMVNQVLPMVLNLTRDKAVLHTMLTYAHAGLLTELFVAAGQPIRFLLFINGKTGSMKTTVSKLLFAPMLPAERQIAATFKSTDAGIESVMGTYKDLVLLIDDMHPCQGSMRREMLQRLESLVRYFGDGVSKVRGTATMDAPQIGVAPQCLCTVTGEDTAGSLSSLLRCLVVNVTPDTFSTDEVAKMQITEFQKNSDLLGSYFLDFVEFTEDDYERLVEQIRVRCSEWRVELSQKYPALRLVDMAAQLLTVLEIECQWLTQRGIDIKTVEQIMRDGSQGVLSTVSMSLEVAAKQEPALVFLRTMYDLMNTGELDIALNSEVYVTDMDTKDGYKHNGYIVFNPSRLYEKVTAELRDRREPFVLSYDQTWHALYETYAILKIEKGKKVSYLAKGKGKDGKRPRMAHIDEQIFLQVMESQE